MATFEYKAATSAGEVVNGVLTASTRAHVIQQLQSLGHVPIRVDESAAQSCRPDCRSIAHCPS
jgi:general secretion pathway protein F